MNKKVIRIIIGIILIGSVAINKYEQYKYTQEKVEMTESYKQFLIEHRSYTDSACRKRKESRRAHGYECECITCIG